MRQILGQHVREFERMGKRRHIGRVELFKLLHIIDDPREVLGHQVQIYVVQLQASQEGYLADVVSREAHFFAFAAAGLAGVAAEAFTGDEAFPDLSPGNTKGFDWTAFCTAPARRQLVQTRIILLPPLGNVTCTLCRLGLNLRREIPVIFVPTPPRYLALPRISTMLPIWLPLPQTSHTLAIAQVPLSLDRLQLGVLIRKWQNSQYISSRPVRNRSASPIAGRIELAA